MRYILYLYVVGLAYYLFDTGIALYFSRWICRRCFGDSLVKSRVCKSFIHLTLCISRLWARLQNLTIAFHHLDCELKIFLVDWLQLLHPPEFFWIYLLFYLLSRSVCIPGEKSICIIFRICFHTVLFTYFPVGAQFHLSPLMSKSHKHSNLHNLFYNFWFYIIVYFVVKTIH